jgi:hypothetical protein
MLRIAKKGKGGKKEEEQKKNGAGNERACS